MAWIDRTYISTIEQNRVKMEEILKERDTI